MHLLRYRDVMLPPLKVSFRGFFVVELIHARTGLIKQRLEFENLITDAGLDSLGATLNINQLVGQYMGVGTGSTAPAVGDTTLVAEIAPQATHRSNSNGSIAEVRGSGGAFAYWYRKITRLFVEAQANGNLTELGLFSASSGGTMWCRQLFKTGAGVPTVIVKTAADQLRVTYELRLYSPVGDAVVSPIVISGVNYDVTTRAVDIDNDTAWGSWGALSLLCGPLVAFKGDVLTTANGTNHAVTSVSSDVLVAATATAPSDAAAVANTSSRNMSAYGGGTYYREQTLIWEPSIGNHVGGIGGITSAIGGVDNGNSMQSAKAFQQKFAPKIPKDNTKRFTFVNRLSWGRYP